VGRVLIYTASHNPRTFVEKVDFVSGPGYLGGPEAWRAAGLPGGGPALVVTPLCTMDFDPGTLRARLRSLHPGVGADQVCAETGFELGGPSVVPVTPGPTRAELAILRQLDPRGVLR
jgi:glutaconate CoA-transferase subunit B